MGVQPLKAAKVAALLYAAGLTPAAQAQAAPAVMINSQLLAMIMVSTPNECVRYTYDLNGNRKTQNSVLWGAPGTTWGSAVYGCFSWTS